MTPQQNREHVRAWYKKNRLAALARQKERNKDPKVKKRQAAYKRKHFK